MSASKLFEAINQGDLEQVSLLLDADSELIHARDEKGISPILAAAYHHQTEIIEELATRTVLLDIFEAAATGSMMQIIRLLARNPDLVNQYSPDGFQPLGLACFFGHIDVAEYLIKAGAEINSQSENEMKVTPLHSATAGNHANIVRLLIKNQADANLRQTGGFTALHSAAQNGNVPILRLLIFNGADLKAKTDGDKIAMDFALEGGHTEAVNLLREGITKRFRSAREIVFPVKRP